MPDGGGAPFSHGIRRVEASLLADPELAGVPIHVIDAQTRDIDAWIAEVETVDAEVIGLAAHVWSFPTFVEVARHLQRNRPERTIILTGPLARPAMFALAPWRDATACISALVHGDELTFRNVVRLSDRSPEALRAVPGLHVPSAEGWVSTGDAPHVPPDELPSPIRMKLLATDRTVPLEICRGGAMSCPSCRVSTGNAGAGVFSEAYLVEELSALRAAGAPGAQIVDAPINLNAEAFRNLVAAEKQVGFFKQAALMASIDPEHVHDEHLEFFRGAAHVHLEARLPPLNKDTGDGTQRPFRESKFAKVIEELSTFTDVEVDILLGLPGDGPVTFRRTLERARELPCKVRIFHCLVLPDDLMTRAPASFELRFDPFTLMMRSCLGWSEDALSRERSRLIEMAYREGGEITPDMWSFPGPREMRRPAMPLGSGVVPPGGEIRVEGATTLAPAGQDLQRVLELGIKEATSGGWTFVEASARPGEIVVIMKTRDGALVVEMRPASPTENAYKVVDGVAFGYRSPRGVKMSDGALRLLDRVLQRLHAPARTALGLSTQDGGPGSARVRRFRATPS
ncbi:oxidoreductase [Sorangium cellulosum]|uniref:Oxidoreductase n=1 Tax=Sorangium cellulosum TaxID=56 RepID=A0A4P2PWF5_SORCE|nr:oxidoreductase [Sorangium cellulosum]AUX21114.1 oxidoreductase [Sorangium cellulosum]